jgi:hypothetical protein
MKLAVDDEFRQICKNIASENLDLSEWREIESDDMFQSNKYCGGFDATEDAFCFSYYQSENQELWFQITIDEVQKILSGEITEITTRPADF